MIRHVFICGMVAAISLLMLYSCLGSNCPKPQAYTQCGKDGNVHWVDTCGVMKAVAQECSTAHGGRCQNSSSRTAECTCNSNWDPGQQCGACRAHYDIGQDCTACLPGWDDSQCSQCVNGGSGKFDPAVSYPSSLHAHAIVAGDFNADGITDLAIAGDDAGGSSTGMVTILLGNGTPGHGDGTFALGDSYGTYPTANALAIGDFNDDGILDLAVGITDSVNILLGNGSDGRGDGTFARKGHWNYPIGTGLTSLITGDFNGDGVPDLAAGTINSVNVLLGHTIDGHADGSFLSPVSTPGCGLSMVAADFNGDGMLDVAGACSAPMHSTLRVLLANGSSGHGDGSFTLANDYTIGSSITAIVAGDFNGDGAVDLVVSTGNEILTHLGNVTNGHGNGTLFLANTLTFPAQLMIAEDFDGDNVLDLAVVNLNTQGASILLGNEGNGRGDGTFALIEDEQAKGMPAAMTTGDFNTDGILDLAVPFNYEWGPGTNIFLGKCREGLCTSGQHACNGQCFSNNDAQHCGPECKPCPSPDNGVATCDNGNCGVRCITGLVPCGASCCRIQSVAVGGYHGCALMTNGTVFCWGLNNVGQLGNGTYADSSKPVEAQGLAGVTAVATGNAHSCAVTSSGGVKCWGANDSLQVGPASQDTTIPADVQGVTGAVAVAAGDRHTCALLSNADVKCWGDNTFGQLGNGATANTSPPVDVQGLTDAFAVTAGGSFSCALTASGGVRCWGQGDTGQLGDGYNPYGYYSTVPVDVSGLLGDAAEAMAGGSHACALTVAGGVKCWGSNSHCQLGTGSGTGPPCYPENSNLPVDVADLSSGVTEVSAGSMHSCALLANGSVKCWGDDRSGQLGDGNSNTTNGTPVDVKGLTGATQISAGSSNTCALMAAGGIECWGGESLFLEDVPF